VGRVPPERVVREPRAGREPRRADAQRSHRTDAERIFGESSPVRFRHPGSAKMLCIGKGCAVRLVHPARFTGKYPWPACARELYLPELEVERHAARGWSGGCFERDRQGGSRNRCTARPYRRMADAPVGTTRRSSCEGNGW
jgi:hypothetical protein